MTNYTHPELSTKTGSIAFALSQNLEVIKKLTEDNNTTLLALKEYVNNIVMTINSKTLKSTATRRFLTALSISKSKTDISFLVYNTILAGDNLKVQ